MSCQDSEEFIRYMRFDLNNQNWSIYNLYDEREMHIHLGNKRSKSNSNLTIQKYLIPITIALSVLISGSIGYIASQIAVRNNSVDSSEITLMNKQLVVTRNKAITVIEAEVPEIISALETYNHDINLISDNINWLKESLEPIRGSAGIINTTITVIDGVNTFTNIPLVENYSTDIKFAKIKLNEVDNLLVRLEELAIIQQEISDSNENLKVLFEEYQKNNSVEDLLLIEEELNSNLIYHIEDLRNLTSEAREVFELSSSILTTLNQAKSVLDFIRDTGKGTLEVVQFWKDDEQISEIEENINKDLEEELAASKEEFQNLPEKIAQQSKKSMTSISRVQKELQTIKVAEMILMNKE